VTKLNVQQLNYIKCLVIAKPKVEADYGDEEAWEDRNGVVWVEA
jgi:hypothetical protein